MFPTSVGIGSHIFRYTLGIQKRLQASHKQSRSERKIYFKPVKQYLFRIYISIHCIYIYINCFICLYVCSFHVSGSYWQTGWEYRIIDLNYTLILLYQRGLQATLSSGSVDLLSQYKPYSTAKRAVLDILYTYSKLLLSLIIILFGLLTKNNSIALQDTKDLIEFTIKYH